MPQGSSGCRSDDRIETIENCNTAILQVGLKPNDEWIGSTTGIPSGCSWRVTSSTRDNGLHWNTQSSGTRGRSDMIPICDRGSKTSIENQENLFFTCFQDFNHKFLYDLRIRIVQMRQNIQLEKSIRYWNAPPHALKSSRKQKFLTMGKDLEQTNVFVKKLRHVRNV